LFWNKKNDGTENRSNYLTSEIDTLFRIDFRDSISKKLEAYWFRTTIRVDPTNVMETKRRAERVKIEIFATVVYCEITFDFVVALNAVGVRAKRTAIEINPI